VGSGNLEVGSENSEVRSGNSEVRSGNSEVGSGEWELLDSNFYVLHNLPLPTPHSPLLERASYNELYPILIIPRKEVSKSNSNSRFDTLHVSPTKRSMPRTSSLFMLVKNPK